MASALPDFPKFEAEEQNASAKWNKWTQRLENLFLALDISDATRKKALLLYYAGERTFDIYENLPDLSAQEAANRDVYEQCKLQLTKYFKP